METDNLLGLDSELDVILHDFAFLADYHREMHPANAGDVSILLSEALGDKVLQTFRDSSQWFHIETLDALAAIRADGRKGYRCEGIHSRSFLQTLMALSGRLLLITRTGSQIPAIRESITQRRDGELLNIIQVNEKADSIRIIYGNAQYGSIPSIETHVHLLGAALMLQEGEISAAVVHAHPPNLIFLGRHPQIKGHFKRFNAALYTSIEGMLRNYEGLVGLVPYAPSGSEQLVNLTSEPFKQHRLILWMNHGFVARTTSIRHAYTLISYAEEAAKAALQTLEMGAAGLPHEVVESFITRSDLLEAYEDLFRKCN